MTEPLLLGIDLGTSSVKVLVVGIDGSVRGTGAAPYPTMQAEPHHAEQDPREWWQATVVATRAALAVAGSTKIAAIGVTGQMHGTVLLGDDGAPIAPAIIWSDARSAAAASAMTAEVGADRVISIAGSPVAPGFQAATLRWMNEHRPDVLARTRRVLTPASFLAWSLTGEHVTDPSDASGTLLFDIRRRDWSPELVAAARIRRDLLPAVLEAGETCGRLTPGAATELGLSPGIPVAAGGGDAPCAALGSGVVGGNTMLLTFSTGAQALLPRGDVRVDPGGRLHTFCSALPPETGAGWYTMGATLAAGMALTWLRTEVFGLSSRQSPREMLGWADEVPAGSRGLIFLPYLAGERTPHMDPLARGVFLGLTARHGRGEIVRATLEGIAFAAYDAYLALTSLGATPERLDAAGGGARMPLWRQTVADLFGLPVFPLLGDEQTALGAAILAGTAIAALDPMESATAWAIRGQPSEPDPDAGARYAALFAVYRRTYGHLKDEMAELTRIEAGATETGRRP